MDGQVTIELFYANEINSTITGENSSFGGPDAQVIFSKATDAALGYLTINTTKQMLNNRTSNNLTLGLIFNDKEYPKFYPGPVFNLTSDPSTSSNSDSGSSNSKKVGEKVGIPIGTIAFVAIVAIGAFLLFRRYRSRQGGGVGGRDYLSGRSHSQRTASGFGAGAGGTSRHGRSESFHDEPTRGVELQQHNSGVSALTPRPGDDGNWDWGKESVSGPSSPTGGGTNVFRDELQRQKTIGRAT